MTHRHICVVTLYYCVDNDVFVHKVFVYIICVSNQFKHNAKYGHGIFAMNFNRKITKNEQSEELFLILERLTELTVFTRQLIKVNHKQRLNLDELLAKFNFDLSKKLVFDNFSN